MKPLEALYWFRFALGIVAALICAGYDLATNIVGDNLRVLTTGIAFAFIVYVLSYYVVKPKLLWKVDNPQKIFTTGMGVYILSWLVFWVLLYTILATNI
ncbi:MAG: hypothetical protein QW175_01300 [Candidatus Bathyarchaeia archaeon]